MIPFLGSIIAAVLGILAALNLSLPLALWTTLLFWGTNAIEGTLLVPQLVGPATGVHPLAVMLAPLAGAKLGGLVGALVVVPLLAGAWEVIRALWVVPINAGEPASDRALGTCSISLALEVRWRRIPVKITERYESLARRCDYGCHCRD